MKLLTISVLGFIAIFFCYVAFADDYTRPYNTHETITNNTTTNQYYTQSVTSYTALSIATSQLQFDKNIEGWQVGAGVGSFDGKQAFSAGIAKQINQKAILNLSAGKQGNKTALGLGINFTLR